MPEHQAQRLVIDLPVNHLSKTTIRTEKMINFDMESLLRILAVTMVADIFLQPCQSQLFYDMTACLALHIW